MFTVGSVDVMSTAMSTAIAVDSRSIFRRRTSTEYR